MDAHPGQLVVAVVGAELFEAGKGGGGVFLAMFLFFRLWRCLTNPSPDSHCNPKWCQRGNLTEGVLKFNK